MPQDLRDRIAALWAGVVQHTLPRAEAQREYLAILTAVSDLRLSPLGARMIELHLRAIYHHMGGIR